jgi:hypothetical protein
MNPSDLTAAIGHVRFYANGGFGAVDPCDCAITFDLHQRSSVAPRLTAEAARPSQARGRRGSDLPVRRR